MDMKTFWKEKTDKKVKAFIVVPAWCFIIGALISGAVIIVGAAAALGSEGSSAVVAILVIIIAINVVLGLTLLISKSKGVAMFLLVSQASSIAKLFTGSWPVFNWISNFILLGLAILAVIGTFQFHEKYADYKLQNQPQSTSFKNRSL